MSTTQTTTEFAQFALGPALQRGIAEAGFTSPRPIQSQAIPDALSGRDVLGLAQTGTGKTAAFALPILERLLSGRGNGDPRALILAPTRELANQIDVEIRTLARFTRVKTVTIYGGMSIQKQVNQLRRGTDIVIACPGRLLDLLNRGALHLKAVETLVLDEADHMFDMGFLPDIKRILKALPAERQNLLFSATMPKEIRGLADNLLSDPLVVELANTMPAETIEHALYPVAEKRKLDLLKYLIDQADFTSAIVFTRTKHRAKRLAEQLDKAGHRAVALQGNMSQAQRDRAMEGFRRGRSDILVATDIAARGIDVANISHVVNFDVPNTPDAYTHRIGRTGRAEKQGKAFTFVTTEDRRQVIGIERKIGARIDRCSVAGFEDPAARFDQRSRPPRESADRSGPPRGRSNGPRGPRSAPREDSRGPREDSRGPRSADSRDRFENRGNRRDARDDRGAPAGGRFANRNERGSVAGNRDRDENRGNRRENPPRDRRDDNRGNRAPRAEGRGNGTGNGGAQRYGRSDSRPGQGAGRGPRAAAGGGNRKSGGNAGGRTRRNSRAS